MRESNAKMVNDTIPEGNYSTTTRAQALEVVMNASYPAAAYVPGGNTKCILTSSLVNQIAIVNENKCIFIFWEINFFIKSDIKSDLIVYSF